MTAVGVITFILVLGVLVFAHEFGHFFIARSLGFKVLKFSLGFGPKIAGFTKGETEYLVSAVPLGGYVKLLGFDADEELTEAEEKVAFINQDLWKKAAVVAAGPIFNLVLAYVICIIVYLAAGLPQPLPVIGVVKDDSPAARASLQKDDQIIAIGNAKVEFWDDIKPVIQESRGRELSITVQRDTKEVNLTIKPNLQEIKNIFGEPVKIWMIGIQPTGAFITEEVGLFRSFQLAFLKTKEMIVLTLTGIFKMIEGVVPADNIGGPILIAKMTSQTAEQGILSVMMFTALLSVNLGLLNLFPIPVLDGGHLFFFAIEGIIRREINIKYKEMAQQVGMALLALLMLFAFYNDFTR